MLRTTPGGHKRQRRYSGFWVVMGAAAISTDAGSAILLADSGVPFLHSMRPFVIGVTLIITGAWATLWIPFLLILDFWKYAICREPVS